MASDSTHPFIEEFFSKYLDLSNDFLQKISQPLFDFIKAKDDDISAEALKTFLDSQWILYCQSKGAEMKKILQPLAEQAFDHHDRDHNGVLSIKESKAFFTHFTKEVKKMTLAASRLHCEKIFTMIAQQMKKEMKKEAKENGDAFNQKDVNEFAKDYRKTMIDLMMAVTEKVVDTSYGNYYKNKKKYDKAGFAFLDVNGDGKLQRKEVLEAMDVTKGKENSKMNGLLKAMGIDDDEMTKLIDADFESCLADKFD